VLSNCGIDISGAYVDKILVVETGTKYQQECSNFMDVVWRAAEVAQKKRRDSKIVQGRNLQVLR
jgi:hypothetical protein